MKKKLLALVMSAVLVSSMMLMTACGDKTTEAESALAEFTYDVNEDPPATKGIVYVEGSWYEMGVQYGQQAKDAVQRSVASGLSGALDMYGSYDEIVKNLDKYTNIVDERAPELIELWEGMAEGAEVTYEHLLISELSYNPEDVYCSTISVWGDNTSDGNLVAGVNSDGGQATAVYTPAVVAYPDEGNAFISYNGFLTNAAMNEKGLVVMASQGQESGEGDIDYGLPACVGVFKTVWSCDTAKQAKNMYIKNKLGPGSGENFHTSDTKGNAFIVEHTSDSDMVRTDEDFGTGDYTIATNGFLIEEMWSSLHQGDEFWDDCLPRYWTEEKIIQDSGNDVTIDTINNALGSNSYYVDDGWYSYVYDEENYIGYKEVENGIWVEDNWDISDMYTGFWSPENREPGTKCNMRTVMDTGNMTMYVMNGCRDTNISVLPEGTGNFWRLSFEKNFGMMTVKSKSYAKVQLYLAERDVDEAIENNSDVSAREESIKTAKSALLKGTAYQDQAGCTEDRNEQLRLLAKAATEYGKAQCYAQLAQDDPTKLQREGENYEVY